MGLNRILRRMGLPFWTFLGVAVSVTVITYGGRIVETMVGGVLNVTGLSGEAANYVVNVVIIFIAFSPVLFAYIWQKKEFNLRRMHIVGGDLAHPQPKKALVLLVSNPNSAMHAIKYHLDGGLLERLWLIPSGDKAKDQFGLGTLSTAEEIREECKALAMSKGTKLKIEVHDGVSPADAQDTFDYVNRIFRLRDYRPEEIVADFTGGTKPMTVGMIMACLPRERELQYVPYNQQTREMHGPYLIDYRHSAFDLVG